MQRKLLLFHVFVLISTLVGCSGLVGSLRDEQSFREDSENGTSGGVWPERGLLEGEDPSYSNYNMEQDERRSPAGYRYRPSEPQDSWVAGDRMSQNRRDSIRSVYNAESVENTGSANDDFVSKNQYGKYKNGVRATRMDFQDTETDGSLWADGGQTNYYFTKNKVRTIGDLLTLKVEPDLIRTVAVELKGRLTDDEMDAEIRRLDKLRSERKDQSDQIKTTAAAPQPQEPVKKGVGNPDNNTDREPANEADPLTGISEDEEINRSHVNLISAMNLQPGDTMMAEILERYPNGNYKIRASKAIQYRNSKRMVRVLGVVRPSDIGEDDIVSSGKLY